MSMRQDGEETRLVRYRYDDRGDMVETTDALDVSKHFVYTDAVSYTHLASFLNLVTTKVTVKGEEQKFVSLRLHQRFNRHHAFTVIAVSYTHLTWLRRPLPKSSRPAPIIRPPSETAD